MGSITVQLMFITILSKLSGFIRESIFAALYGAGPVKDIFVTSTTIASMAFGFLFVSLESCFIPIYNKVRKEKGREQADLLTANITNVIILLVTGIILFCFLLMKPIVSLVAAGFQGQQFEEAVKFSRIVIFELYFWASFGFMVPYLNIYGNFRVPASIGILMNVILILALFLSARFNSLLVLALGGVASEGLKFIFFPRALRKAGYKHRFFVDFKDPYVKEAVTMAIPVMISILVNDISVIIDQSMASYLMPVGGVSTINYANMVNQIIYGVVIVSIMTATYPRMSGLAQEGEMDKLKKLTLRSINIGLILVIPAAIGLMFFARPVISLFFERKAFDAESARLTAQILFCYAPGLIALVFTSIFNRLFYALSDTKSPVKIAGVQVGVAVILNFILSRFLGLMGLAIATTVGNYIGVLLLYKSLRGKIGSLNFRANVISFLKIMGISLVMGFIAHWAYGVLPFSGNLKLLVSVIIGALTYTGLVLVSGIPEVAYLVDSLKNKLNKKKGKSSTTPLP